jgi:sec-independent protein translocase protein TatB
MFDFDVSKLMIVAIVALAVIPPKDLPRVMRTVGQAIGKMRRMAAEFQGQFMDAMREADLESVKKEFAALGEQAKIDAAFDPAAMIRDDVTKAVQGPAEVATSEVALNPPLNPGEPAPGGALDRPAVDLPAPHEADLDSVRKELEALNEKAKIEAAFAVRGDGTEPVQRPAAVAASESAPNAPVPLAAESHAPAEAPSAKRSAAE